VNQQTLIHAAYVVPVRPRRSVLERHSVLIEGERIAAVLPREQAHARYPAAVEVELGTHVLIPGLMNMHTHSPMTLFRGYADDKDMQAWLRDDVWPLEARFVDHGFVLEGTRLAAAEMIRAGTTCFNDLYFFPDAVAEVAQQSGMRACIGIPIIDMPTAWAADIDEYFAKGLELADRFAEVPRIGFSLAPHAPYTVDDDTLGRIAELSAERDLPVHLHLLETAWEIEHSMREYGISPLERLQAHGLIGERLLAVHMTQLQDADIQRLAEGRVNVIHCPESNLKLASGICPLSALLQASVNVALGTDGAASNNDLDMLAEARTAALLAKGISGNPRVPAAFDMLEMLTINAARALGLSDRVGSIEPGKQADLAALDLRQVQTQPVHDVVSALLYSASSSQFTDVWVDGRRLLNGRELTTLDQEAILDSAAKWHDRMRSTAGPAASGGMGA
jgi:5-methylthioadenosine/S-adenosylhomocysteine deaminase